MHKRTKLSALELSAGHAGTADTAKLVATFATGVAAALVAAALQTGSPSNTDRAGAWLLAASGALVLLVVIVHRSSTAADPRCEETAPRLPMVRMVCGGPLKVA
jgi:hypothetical protein